MDNRTNQLEREADFKGIKNLNKFLETIKRMEKAGFIEKPHYRLSLPSKPYQIGRTY